MQGLFFPLFHLAHQKQRYVYNGRYDLFSPCLPVLHIVIFIGSFQPYQVTGISLLRIHYIVTH